MKRNIIVNTELISLLFLNNLKKLTLDFCGKDWKSFRAETSSQKSHGIGKAKLEEAFDTSLHIAFKKRHLSSFKAVIVLYSPLTLFRVNRPH